MDANNDYFVGPLEARLHAIIEEYCARERLGLRAFGAAVMDDAEFAPDLEGGRSPKLTTVDRVLAGMGMPPAGPAFKEEVEAFLAVTGTKVSVLGRCAVKNPSFVPHLRDGTSPQLRTVHRVRSWMAAEAHADEARAIRRRVGPMPEPLSDTPRRRRRRSSRPRPLPPIANNGDGQPAGDRNGPLFLDTKEAAALVGLAPETLARYRSVGGGPAYCLLPERVVRYRHKDLAEWDADRRRT